MALLIAVATAVYLLFLRPPAEDDRTQILRMISDVQRAVEQRRTSDVVRHISADYHDSRGYDHRTVQRLILAGARSQITLDLSVTVTDITVTGDSASFAAEVDYSTGGPVSPGESAHLSVIGQLRREGRYWRIISADGWQNVEGAFQE